MNTLQAHLDHQEKSNDLIKITAPSWRIIELSRTTIDKILNEVIYGQSKVKEPQSQEDHQEQSKRIVELSIDGKPFILSMQKIKESSKKVLDEVRSRPKEKLISYGFSPTEIEYLEKKCRGLTSSFGFSRPLDALEEACWIGENPTDLERAYYKLKLKEMTRVGYGLNLGEANFKSFIENVEPMDPIVLGKLEFYGFWFHDLIKVKSQDFKLLGEIIASLEELYHLPAEMSEEKRVQLADHLRQELGIQK